MLVSRLRSLTLLTIMVGLLMPAVSFGLADEKIEENLKLIKLPEGFRIDLYAGDLPHARSFALGDEGTVFVSTRKGKHVYAIVDADGDHKAEKTYKVYTLGDVGDGKERVMPNGVAFRDGSLYIATLSSVLRIDDIEANLADPPKPIVLVDDYPKEKVHGWKYIGFGPDGKLYIPVGSPCNTCDPEEDIFGTITRINIDGTGREIIAHGIRNTVGFDWHPETGELWFTDNGADKLGDDIPPDELNRITEVGQHFGSPFVHGGDFIDPNVGGGHDPADYVAPELNLGPHVAALGMRFYTGAMFPDTYENQAFIAEHGSGGRAELIGYRVTLARSDASGMSYEDFATGWIQDNKAWGRPVDLEILGDGSMLVSDDRAGAVYRISYQP